MTSETPPVVQRRPILAVPLHLAMTAMHRLRRSLWFVTTPVTVGVKAIPLLPDGRVVMVRHTYVRGWHLPGGKVEAGETPAAAVERELREEIGMTGSRGPAFVAAFDHRPDFKRDTVHLYVARDVAYVPRLSLEIEAIGAFAPDALPPETTPATRRRLAELASGAPPPAYW